MATVIDPKDLDLGTAKNVAGQAPAGGDSSVVNPADLVAPAAAAPVVQAPTGGAAPSMVSQLGRQVGLSARALVQGATDLPVAVNDLALQYVQNPIARLLGLPQAQPLAQTRDAALDRVLPTPETRTEKIVNMGARAVAGAPTLPIGGPVNMTQAAAAAGGGLLPEFARQNFDVQNPLALMGLGIAGSLAAGGVASRAGNVATGGNYRDPQTGQLVERARAEGVNLTPADVAPQGAGRVQRVARTVGINADDRAAERAGQVTSLIERNVESARPPSVTATGSADRAVAADLRQQYTAAKNTARTMYNAVDTAIAAQPGSGNLAPTTTQQVAAQLQQQFPEWATLTNASRATSGRLEGIVRGTGPRQSAVLGPNGQPMQLPPQASFADMRRLSTEVGQLVDATRTDPKLAAVHGQLKQLYGAIQQDVDNWAQTTTNRAAADAYGNAQNFFRNNVAPFRNDPTLYRTVSSRTPTADFDKQAQKLTESLLGAGNETTQLAVNLMSPEGRQAFAFSIMEKARARGINQDNAAEFTAPGFMRAMNLGRADTPTPQRIAMQGAPGLLQQAELTGQIVDATRGALTPKVAPQTGVRLLPLATTGSAGSLGEAAGQALGLPPLVGGTAGAVGVPLAARGLDALMGTRAGTRFALGAPYQGGAGLLSPLAPLFTQGQQ